jgi:ankyrin repeat protein
VKGVLFSGAAVDIKDYALNEPLHYAVVSNSLTIVQELLRFGAHPDVTGQLGRSAVHLATSSQKILTALLLNGASTSMQDNNGDTPLHLVLPLEANDPAMSSIVKELLSSGANVNLANNAGHSPFHRLVERNVYSIQALELLTKFLDAGADIDVALLTGKSAFQHFLAVSEENWDAERSISDPGGESCVQEVFRKRS